MESKTATWSGLVAEIEETIYYLNSLKRLPDEELIHAFDVCNALIPTRRGSRVKCLALLHDSIEDGWMTEQEVEELCGEEFLADLPLLTHHEGQSNKEYLAACKTNEDVRVVKIADTMVNISRNVNDKDWKRAEYYNKRLAVLINEDK